MAEASLRDRALAAIDNAVVDLIAKEAETAWAKRAGGQPENSVVEQFAGSLPKLFALRERLRAAVAVTAAAAPPAGASS